MKVNTFKNPLTNTRFVRKLTDPSAEIWRGEDEQGRTLPYIVFGTVKSKGCCFVPQDDWEPAYEARAAAFAELNSPDIKGECLTLDDLHKLLRHKGQPSKSRTNRSDFWAVDAAEIGVTVDPWAEFRDDPVLDGATEDEGADDGEDSSSSDLELTREECATLGLCYPERRNPKMRTLMSKLISNGLRFEVVNGVRRIS